jgi:small subunit ribosomal protein S4
LAFCASGHVLLNGKRCNISSALLKPGDQISLKDKVRNIPAVLDAITSVEREVPEYIEVDHSKFSAKFLRVPSLDEVPYPVQMEPNLVVEYYSR